MTSGNRNEIYIPTAIAVPSELLFSYQYAKDFLESIAIFDKVMSARVYKYLITPLSLHNAALSGYSSNEIIRILVLLSKNEIQDHLYDIVKNNMALNYFQYQFRIINNRQMVCASSKEKIDNVLFLYAY